MGAPVRATYSSVTTTTVTTSARLKREDFRRTKHDSAFSRWQVLIGPSDWENYEAGKEWAERYRVGNLPPVCGSGLYEIGVAVTRTDSGRDVDKLEPDRIVVVYLGQADNVRSRLQHYGRTGSHLVHHRCSAVPEPVGDGYRTGTFKEIFSRGYPIVYRWAPMKSKADAEHMEAKLLEKFDYGWNKVSNGARRPHDVLNKIDNISLKTNNIPKILKILQALSDQKVGITVKSENSSNHDEIFNFFGRVLKFSRSQPRSVSANPSTLVDQTRVCGVGLGDGLICSNLPVEGRKRCLEHKGRRLTKNVSMASNKQAFPQGNAVSKGIFPVCGVTQNDGSLCQMPPFPGWKRCEKHKGQRVGRVVSISMDSSSVNVDISLSNLGLGDYCRVDLGDGECCRSPPVKGRKRCEEHKGMRVDAYISKLSKMNWVT